LLDWRSMRVAVFGAGGVGGYFGTRLAEAGHELSIVARGAHLAAIRRNGLRLESPRGDVVVRPRVATSEPAEIGPVDWVICGVKAWQVGEAAETMRPLIGPGTAVLPLQNGVEASDQLAAVLGADHVVSGACWIVAMVAAAGLIREQGVEPRVAFAERQGGASARVEALRAAFAAARVPCEVPDDMRRVLWEKFTFITAVSGVGAVTGVPVGDYRDVPESRALLAAAIAEVAAVGRAHGVALPTELEVRTLAFVDGLLPATRPSLQRDVEEGRPSELEAQNGAVVRLGRARGVPTPTHALLYAALLPRERVARRA